jgi:hypothetical protein
VERLEEAGRELQALLKYDELQRAILLVYANKQVCSIPPTQLYVAHSPQLCTHAGPAICAVIVNCGGQAWT